MTSSTVDEKIIREITTFDEKEFLLNKSKVDFSVDDDAYDKRWNNTYEYRNSDKEFVLTDNPFSFVADNMHVKRKKVFQILSSLDYSLLNKR